MRLFILFLSLLSFSLAQPVVNINSDKSVITDFELSYFIDSTNELKFEDIKSMKFSKGKNKDSLGVKVKEAWIKIELFNATKQMQTLFLHQDIAYKYTSLEYFELDNSNNLIRKKLLTPYSSETKEQICGADAIFEFTLDSQEHKTIFVHQKTPAYHFYNFFIFSQKESIISWNKHWTYYRSTTSLLFGFT